MGTTFLGRLGDYTSALAGVSEFKCWSGTVTTSNVSSVLLVPSFTPDIGFVWSQIGISGSSHSPFVVPVQIGGSYRWEFISSGYCKISIATSGNVSLTELTSSSVSLGVIVVKF